MPKHARKKQKISKDVKHAAPLGAADALLDDALKDDEERKLESILFGVKYVPKGDGTVKETEEENAGAVYGGNVFNNLLDSDLFFVDDGAGVPQSENDGEADEKADSNDDDDSHPEDSDVESSASSSSTTEIKPTPNPLLKPRKAPAWTDPSDPPSVSLSAPRLRKLRDAPSEKTLSGREYEARLRRQYERINPEPAWAAQARSKTKKAREEGEGGVEDLLASTDGILASREGRKGRVQLKAGTVDLERLRDANLAVQGSGSGEVRVVAFHPSEHVPVLCVGSADRRVRLFNIDGHTNPLLQTLHVPSLPLTSQSSVSFHPSGSSLLLTGPRPFFYTHDLQSGVTTRHARGLWGTTFNTIKSSSASLSRKRSRGDAEGGGGKGSGEGMEITAFSPGGDILAVAGRGGYVHLVDWACGAGQVVGSLKCGSGGGGVKALWWPSSSTQERRELAVMSGDAEVYLWDVGFVNVYGPDSFSPSGENTTPKPLKSIANLTTAISAVRFNHDAQLMTVASQEKKDAMRLIHTPTLTSFSNWPTSGTPLGHVTAVDFSAHSEYLAIGNTRGRVLLYHLKDYGI
ncbi:hypothetical protein H0H87_007195 [Tephrocybe sp. NHM501043]|nr:hypothetical protein H0H87_007195 [Tephrocybe sp. NHM501043]